MKFHGMVSENMLEHILPENGTLQLHFWNNSLNYEASLKAPRFFFERYTALK